MRSETPAVSVIMSTYNRSNVIGYSIRSLLRSTFTEWELLVIGDACTDDTDKVVQSFHDARIRWVNLEKNYGEQSGPHNEGARLARGRYIAYLNHDDLWMHDHLAVTLRELEETGADLVFTLGLSVIPGGRNRLMCAKVADGRFMPRFFVPASCWVFRRELLESVGPWRFYKDCYNIPSQDWLFRAYRAGKDLRLAPHLTLIAIQAGKRANVYADRAEAENSAYYERMVSDSAFRETELTQIALDYEAQIDDASFPRHPVRFLRRKANLLLFSMGLSATILRNFVRYGRKGGFIDRLRKREGLD